MRASGVIQNALQIGGDTGPQGAGNPAAQVATTWDTIVARIARLTESGMRPSNNPTQQIDQLSGLLRLQVDVSRYQLRVELVSKVSESAVASMRKLQQNQ
jgi:hypothetical protein